MSDYRLDRILGEEEVDQLGALLIPKFKDSYPNFELWLENAQKDILREKNPKIAIGIWKEGLIATSILKFTASNTAELKSFFIDDSFRMEGYSTELYEEIEMQCRKAGVNRISTDIYLDNISMIEFLISKEFIVAGKDDLYGNSRESYILSKTLKDKYLGDPYDWENLGEWYLKTKLNAIIVKPHPTVLGRKFDRHMRIIIENYPLEILAEIKDQKVDQDIVEILHKKCMESDYHLAIFIAREFTDRAIQYARDHGVIIFDKRDLSEVLGKIPPVFREDSINGMVVSIKPKYLNRILERGPPFYYVKGGPMGKYLEKGQTIVFYTTAPEKNVTTLGKVESLKLGSPREIWDSIGDKTVFTEKEFFNFAGLKRKVCAIELNEIWNIKPLEGDDLDGIIPKKDRSGSYIDTKKLGLILERK
jgi:predicted transcriptional regulator/GNAT superfamily N-acetyltransferase